MAQRTAMKLPSHDTLSKLACDDPRAFEALRDELVASCIESAPERLQQRLYGLQFRVDAIRRLSRSPLGALMKIHAMMWRSFLDLDHELKSFSQRPGSRTPPLRSGGGARVIPFQTRSMGGNR